MASSWDSQIRPGDKLMLISEDASSLSLFPPVRHITAHTLVNTKANVRLLLAAASSPSIFDSGKSPLPVPIPREVVSRLVEKSVSGLRARKAVASLQAQANTGRWKQC